MRTTGWPDAAGGRDPRTPYPLFWNGEVWSPFTEGTFQPLRPGLRILDLTIATNPPLAGQAYHLWTVFPDELRILNQQLRDRRRNTQLLIQATQSLDLAEEAMTQMFAVPCAAGSRPDTRPLLGPGAVTPAAPSAAGFPPKITPTVAPMLCVLFHNTVQ